METPTDKQEYDTEEYTCAACAVPLFEVECVDCIDLETHDADVVCVECSEHEHISMDFHIIPEHAFGVPLYVEEQVSVDVVTIRSVEDVEADNPQGA